MHGIITEQPITAHWQPPFRDAFNQASLADAAPQAALAKARWQS